MSRRIIPIKYRFKIHNINVCQGLSDAPPYNTAFKETYDEAMEAALNCISGVSSSPAKGIVIFEARTVVMRKRPDVDIIDLYGDSFTLEPR